MAEEEGGQTYRQYTQGKSFTIKKIENQFEGELGVTRDFLFNDHKGRSMEWKGKKVEESLLGKRRCSNRTIKRGGKRLFGGEKKGAMSLEGE